MRRSITLSLLLSACLTNVSAQNGMGPFSMLMSRGQVPMLSCSRVSHAPSSENLSTDVQETQPAGELHDKLMRSSRYFLFNNFTGMVDGDDRGSMSKIVVSDDGLGEHESLNHYMFAIGASYGIVSQKDPYWGGSYDTYNYEFVPSFTMDYDAATKTFSTDTSDSSVLMVNCCPDRVFFIASYISPKITMLHQGPKTPQKPVINVSKSADYDEEYGKGWIEFNASKVDVNGDYMPVENLYYRVFVDGSTTAYTFKADDYGSIKTDTTAIPVTKNDGFYFTERESGNDYVVSFDYFIEQYKSIGVQLVYHYDGKDYPSEMAYFGEPLTAISAVMANSKATKVKYYGLNGRELKGSYKGVAIKKEMVDGHVVRATKVIR